MMKQFYIVIWGGNVRMSYKVKTAHEACLSSYGLWARDMKVIPAGGNQIKALKQMEALVIEHSLEGK